MEQEPYKISVKDLLVRGSVGDKEVLKVKSSSEIVLDEENTLMGYEGEIKATILEDEILVEFGINYRCETICARCLKKFNRKGKLSFDREYMTGKRVAEGDELIVDKEFKVEVGGPIFEEIVLDIPMKPRCKESCKGINKV